MFFLIRCAFWVGVVFIGAQLLSGGRGDRSADVADVAPAGSAPAVAADAAALPPAAAASEATVSVAPGPSVAVLSDVLRLCSEHGSACAAGFSAIDALGGAIGDGLALLTGEDGQAADATGAVMPEAVDPAAAPPPASGEDAGAAGDEGAALAAAAAAVAGTLTAADLSEPWLGRAAAIIAGSGAAQRLPPPDPRRDPPPG